MRNPKMAEHLPHIRVGEHQQIVETTHPIAFVGNLGCLSSHKLQHDVFFTARLAFLHMLKRIYIYIYYIYSAVKKKDEHLELSNMFNILSNHFGEVIFISFAKSHDLTEPGKVFCSKNTSHVESISSKTQE